MKMFHSFLILCFIFLPFTILKKALAYDLESETKIIDNLEKKWGTHELAHKVYQLGTKLDIDQDNLMRIIPPLQDSSSMNENELTSYLEKESKFIDSALDNFKTFDFPRGDELNNYLDRNKNLCFFISGIHSKQGLIFSPLVDTVFQRSGKHHAVEQKISKWTHTNLMKYFHPDKDQYGISKNDHQCLVFPGWSYFHLFFKKHQKKLTNKKIILDFEGHGNYRLAACDREVTFNKNIVSIITDIAKTNQVAFFERSCFSGDRLKLLMQKTLNKKLKENICVVSSSFIGRDSYDSYLNYDFIVLQLNARLNQTVLDLLPYGHLNSALPFESLESKKNDFKKLLEEQFFSIFRPQIHPSPTDCLTCKRYQNIGSPNTNEYFQKINDIMVWNQEEYGNLLQSIDAQNDLSWYKGCQSFGRIWGEGH